MPTYAYACTTAGHRFDAVQSFTDAALTECIECGGPVRKQYGSVGVTFNGSGFYRTDSRAGSGGSSSTKKDAASGAATSGPTSSKTEAKSSPAPSGS